MSKLKFQNIFLVHLTIVLPTWPGGGYHPTNFHDEGTKTPKFVR